MLNVSSIFLFVLGECSLAVVHGVGWVQQLNHSNLFFHHLGDLRVEQGTFRVVKTVNVSLLDEQIRQVQREVLSFSNSCLQRNCVWRQEGSAKFVFEAKGLTHELRSIFALLGGSRSKRGINFVGSIYHYLFGVMDHDDEVYIQKVLQNLGDRQDKLHLTMQKSVQVIQNMTKQWEFLKDNQRILLKNFKMLKHLMDVYQQEQEKFNFQVEDQVVEVHLENLLVSAHAQINKLKNAILFLKAGVVDPYFLEEEELADALAGNKLNYNLTLKDIDLILSHMKPVAIYDSSRKLIHIIFSIPMAREKKFHLYENFIVPKVTGKDIVALRDIPKYFAVSEDNRAYILTETLDCFTIFGVYICKESLTFDVRMKRDCVTDIYYQGTDDLCKYKTISTKFDVHTVLDNGIILFAATQMDIHLKCGGGFTENHTLIGAFWLKPPKSCEVSSPLFNFTALSDKGKIDLQDIIPEISCCSTHFKKIDFKSSNLESVTFKTLHDIRVIDSSELGRDLSHWTKFPTVNFDHLKPWHISFSFILIIIILAFCLYYRCRYKCAGSRNNTVVQFRSVPTQSEHKF